MDGMDGMDGMGWMGWDGMDGRSTFFFGPYLENYYIIFLNCFSSLKYMDLHIFWNVRRKKSECSFFKIFLQNQQPPFSRKFLQGFVEYLENDLNWKERIYMGFP